MSQLSPRMRFIVFAIAAAIALLTGCGGGGDPVSPVRCPDGSVAPGNDVSRCPVIPPPETVSVVSLSASTNFVGVTYPMARVTITASGQSTAGKTVTVAVTVDGSSVNGSTMLPEGSHNLCATATSSSGVKSNEACQVLAITWPEIVGRFVATTPTDEYVPQGLWAVVEDVDSVRVNPDGTFTIHTISALKDTAKVVIRGSNEVFPTLARVERKYYGNYVQIGSIKNWTIPTGTYAGQTIALSLEKAFKPTSPQPFGFFQRGQKTGEGGAYRYLVGSYTSYPVKVAVFRDRSNFPLSAVDEAKLWARLAEMEQTMGFDLFVQSDTNSVNIGGGLRVVFDSNRTTGGTDNPTLGDYLFGTVTLGPGTSGTLIILDPQYGVTTKHEFLHASGPISHTCQWMSAMEQNCLRNLPNDLTLEDVAYWHTMRLVRGLERKYNTRFSLAQMHQGERVFLLNLPEDKIVVHGTDGFSW